VVTLLLLGIMAEVCTASAVASSPITDLHPLPSAPSAIQLPLTVQVNLISVDMRAAYKTNRPSKASKRVTFDVASLRNSIVTYAEQRRTFPQIVKSASEGTDVILTLKATYTRIYAPKADEFMIERVLTNQEKTELGVYTGKGESPIRDKTTAAMTPALAQALDHLFEQIEGDQERVLAKIRESRQPTPPPIY
jgi:hypothetical protein